MFNDRLQYLLQHSLFVLCFSICFVPASRAQTMYGLSGNTLFSFQAANPVVVSGMNPVTGITAGQVIAGLDVRPATGELFALGYNAGTGEARLYILNPSTGVATAVGAAAITLQPGIGDLGFDFNPTVDRIRVTGSNGANYRLNPNNGALAATDGTLAYKSDDVNAGATPSVVAVAYTNSFIGSASTTLFNYDLGLNIITTQNPPNNGTLNTVGSSGITPNAANPLLDLDLYTDPNDCLNRGFLVANSPASANSGLYWFDPTSGMATLIGMIGSGMPVNDFAVAIDRTVPASASGDLIFGITNTNFLVTLDANDPGTIRQQAAVSGLTAGQTLVGIDFRPATGELFGLGYAAANGEARLYTIDPDNGQATAVGATSFTLAPNLANLAFDFNPTVDRIRVTASNGANYRLNPLTGGLAATDTNLSYAAGDANAGASPSVGTAAYTNSFAGSTSTLLYTYDDVLNVFASLAAPNGGVMTTLGSSGLTLDASQGPGSADLDIAYDPISQQNRAYFAANPAGNFINDNLYRVELATGSLTALGRIGCGINLVDFAVKANSGGDEDPGGYCEGKSQGCLRWEIVDIRRDAQGDKTYRIRVINNCSSAMKSTAFGLPQGLTVTDLANNSTYTAPSGRTYQVRNPNAVPVYSIRFQTQNTTGISGGQSDLFEYTLPQQADPYFIYAYTRLTNGQAYEAHLLTGNCDVQPYSDLGNRSGDDRSMQQGAGQLELRVYPNPSRGLLFVELGAAQTTTIVVLNALGQTVFQQELPATDEAQALQLPESLGNGVYFLNVRTNEGKPVLRRFLLQRD